MTQRKTTEQFIELANEKHNNRYDYTNVKYINCDAKVLIICENHGPFNQSPYLHLRGAGCKKCTDQAKGISKRKNIKSFISNATSVHADKYDYSKSKYIGANDKIIIICKIHGEFNQIPRDHIQGKGCNQCAIITRYDKQRNTIEQFISSAIDMNGDKYDYSKVEYKNYHTKLIIICKIHGEFEQKSSHHLKGSGCKLCGVNTRADLKRSNTDTFIEKARIVHGDKYDYSKTEYVHSDIKLIIICKIHGKFEQDPSSHLVGHNCSKCTNTKKLTTFEFIEKARLVHGDKYDYSKVDYINSDMNIIIICKVHGEFKQIPYNHLNGRTCPFCKNKTEGKLLLFLESNNFIVEHQKKFEWCKNKTYLPFDFYIPDLNLIIELDGDQHFKQVMNWPAPEETQKIDNYKMRLANENNLSVIRLHQPIVWENKDNWQQQLLDCIKQYDAPTNILIGDIYNQIYGDETNIHHTLIWKDL